MSFYSTIYAWTIRKKRISQNTSLRLTNLATARPENKSMVLSKQWRRRKGILKSEKVTDGWWRRFMERQPQLSLRRGDPTAHVFMNAVNKEGYFALLEETLNEHDLMNSPSQLYNMDESGVPLDSHPPNVIAKRVQKNVRYRTASNKDQITVIGCANAAGQSVPPMIISKTSTSTMNPPNVSTPMRAITSQLPSQLAPQP